MSEAEEAEVECRRAGAKCKGSEEHGFRWLWKVRKEVEWTDDGRLVVSGEKFANLEILGRGHLLD